MLEPRRLAARLAARRVADELGETLGGTRRLPGALRGRLERPDAHPLRDRGGARAQLLASPDLEGVGGRRARRVPRAAPAGRRRARAPRAAPARPRAPICASSRCPRRSRRGRSPSSSARPCCAPKGGASRSRSSTSRPPDDRPLASQVASAVRVARGRRTRRGRARVPARARARSAARARRAQRSRAKRTCSSCRSTATSPPQEQDAAVRPADRAQGDPLDERGRVVGHDRRRRRGRRLRPRRASLRRRRGRGSRGCASRRSAAPRRRSAPVAPDERVRVGAFASTRGPISTRGPSTTRPRSAGSISPRRGSSSRRSAPTDLAVARGAARGDVRAARELLARLGALDAHGDASPTPGARCCGSPCTRARPASSSRASGAASREDACVAAAILGEGDIAGVEPGAIRRTDAIDDRADRVVRSRRARRSLSRGRGLALLGGRAPRGRARRRRDARRGARRLAARARVEARRPRPRWAGGRRRRRRAADGAPRRLPGSGGQARAPGGDAPWPSPAEARRSSPRRASCATPSGSSALDAEERAGAPVGPRGMSRPAARGGVVVRLASAIEPEWLLDLFPDDVVESRVGDLGRARRARAGARVDDVGRPRAPRVRARGRVRAGGVARPRRSGARGGTGGVRAARGLRSLARAGALRRVGRRVPARARRTTRSAPRSSQLCEGRSSFAELREAVSWTR